MLRAIKNGSHLPRIEIVARTIEKDIKSKGLKAGDKYMTSLQVARRLKVGNEVANRAMQLLAQRNVIDRRHRAGTFVGSGQLDTDAPILKRVHLVVDRHNVETYGVLRDGTISGLHSVLPGCQMQFSFVPERGEKEYVAELIRESLGSSVSSGFVLYRSNPETQMAVAQSGMPAVISGSRWPGISNIPCFSKDHYSMGRKSAEYLLSRGHERIAFFTRDDMFTSDHDILDGIRDAVDFAGLGSKSLTFRSVPLKPFIIQGTAEMVLNSNGDSPTAFICREQILAGNVKSVASDSTEIAMIDFFEAPQCVAEFPYLRGTITPEKEGEIIGEMLVNMSNNIGQPPKDYIEEVEFVRL